MLFIKRKLRKLISYLLKNISVCLYKAKIEEENVQKLRELQNIHAGKRGFIICNGPSLNPKDLDKIHLNNEISFASNHIDKIFDKTIWRPTYYTVMDETIHKNLLNVIHNIPAKNKFFRIENCIKIKALNNAIFLNAVGDRKLLENPKFSENCDDVIYTIATVTYSMIQLFVYMGINEIYIIGCDNYYSKEILKDGTIIDHNVQSYFEGTEKKRINNGAAATWEMNVAYEYARKYADKNGIKIYNATRGGYLDAFERVNFDTLFDLWSLDQKE